MYWTQSNRLTFQCTTYWAIEIDLRLISGIRLEFEHTANILVYSINNRLNCSTLLTFWNTVNMNPANLIVVCCTFNILGFSYYYFIITVVLLEIGAIPGKYILWMLRFSTWSKSGTLGIIINVWRVIIMHEIQPLTVLVEPLKVYEISYIKCMLENYFF